LKGNGGGKVEQNSRWVPPIKAKTFIHLKQKSRKMGGGRGGREEILKEQG
jgi:hypothetical protein